MSSNLVERRVTVVFVDSYHSLKLVEIKAKIRYDYVNQKYRVDRAAAEEAARFRIGEPDEKLAKLDEKLAKLGINYNGLDFVGILVAHDIPTERGRITWAEEVEVIESVEV